MYSEETCYVFSLPVQLMINLHYLVIFLVFSHLFSSLPLFFRFLPSLLLSSPFSFSALLSNSQPPIQASPLLKDSRNWLENEALIPGFIDDNDHSFTEDIMKTLDQRPSFKEILTPVMENTHDEDFNKSSMSEGEEEEVAIVAATTQHNLERGRRRAQSLTKSTTTNTSEQESVEGQDEESDVFSHTPPSSSEPEAIHQKTIFSSRSEDNLLQCGTSFSPEEEEEEEQRRDNFEAVIKKYMVESSGRKSTGSTCSSSDLQDTSVSGADYKPYLPDLQMILMETSSLPSSPRSSIFSTSSSTKHGTPTHSLPRNFTQKHHRLPMRQYSEGFIHLERSPILFQISPPLTSPVSLVSAGKASSQGSFSEGFSEDLPEEMRKREGDLTEERSAEEEVEEEEEEEEAEAVDGLHEISASAHVHKGDQLVAKEENEVENSKLDVAEQQHERCKTDSGIDEAVTLLHGTEEDQHIGDELPLPDNSPSRHSLRISFTNSESRDSGLSDSPDPFVEFSQGKNYKMSPQRHSASSLTQSSRHAPQDTFTSSSSSSDSSRQLTTAGSSSSAVPTYTEDYHRHMTSSPESPQADSDDPGATQSVSQVLSSATKPDLSLSDELLMKHTSSERVRSASPDELLTPMQQMTRMKRSQSHGEALMTTHNTKPHSFSHQMKHGHLLILADSNNGTKGEGHLDPTSQEKPDKREDKGEPGGESEAGAKETLKGRGKKRRKYKSSESLNDSSSSPRSHRRMPFFV